MHTQHANAITMSDYWYFHCDFQQNIALFCIISDFVLLLLFADASVQYNSCDPENRFFQGGTLEIHVACLHFNWIRKSNRATVASEKTFEKVRGRL